ncbi:hypothetical protein ACOMICROBIO_LMKGKHOH_02739 [Vibrio sp. B1FIG11]|uniref:hypothetical protein n=1 Tax=Vibrio sp. B1FIG11 TaxID=2751177 RepID=UPI001AF73429|nr:hypothetical protein [Vibrio sp. B1FIG11]CAD7810213.1 hypothetical protein ACOMICROBIO_LMKGKHOH_02739 [Vibrio sp. B1FIG11]CAE6911438.1 hypothetical protein ACOMICROBIO_LMKGKHOH_02739 [Vibrio sp. B1FIG11]
MKLLLTWLCIVFLCSPIVAFSAEVKIRLRADGASGISAEQHGDQLVPSIWDIHGNIPPAKKVVLGTAQASGHEIPVFLGNGAGVQISVPITFIGMEYMLQGAANTQESDIASSVANTTISGKKVTVIGSGLSDTRLTFGEEKSPFTHSRPVFKGLDASAIFAAFSNENAPRGTYSGRINSTVPYDYYTSDGMRKRNIFTFTTRIIIDYKPAQVTSVTVDRQPVIPARYYDHPDVKVGGQTNVNVTLTGDFSGGLKLGLKNTLIGEPYYSMKYVSETPQSGLRDIPFFVACQQGCEGGYKNIIDPKGIAQIDNANNRLNVSVGSDTKQRRINLAVGFDGVPLSELKAGEYRGLFTLVFEAQL